VQVPFTLRYILCMVTCVLQDQQYIFGVRRLLIAEKMLLIGNDLAAARVFLFIALSETWDKCLNELDDT